MGEYGWDREKREEESRERETVFSITERKEKKPMLHICLK